ncbi:ATP-binding protein [Klebsiella michiganensis]|uniref:ATP-binding protein n=1 Tax=Klebsiella michiganensis TaxID=1134687 RepID=UPI0018D942B6|nr:ATP-binding protein [Klebsiella michiganensis]
MTIEIRGQQKYKDFLLEQPVVFNEKIILLTGKNGSGKTRFLESIKNKCSTTYIDTNQVSLTDIILIQDIGVDLKSKDQYNDANHRKYIETCLQLFDQYKTHIDSPEGVQEPEALRRSTSDIDYESLCQICGLISHKTGKRISDLTHDDIILNFELPIKNALGIPNVSEIVNTYIKRRNTNNYNMWLNTNQNKSTPYWDDEKFIDKYGAKPWIIINEILSEVFDGKFEFSTPDETSHSYNYQASLIQRSNGISVSVENLSSGEKILLWLALTLFNTQYNHNKIVNTPKIVLIDEPDAFLHPKMVLKMHNILGSFVKYFNATVIITSHSPTSVALAPNESIYLVDNNVVQKIEKDSAITELLDGVTQISLNPNNRRQVFVESQYDADVYQILFSKLMHRSEKIDPKISLTFISSGAKTPKQQLIEKAMQVFKIQDEDLLNEFVVSVNGVGDCSKVIGQVEALVENENDTVRGIIDWDLKNNATEYVKVFAEKYAYSIENVTLDPICILLLLHIDKPESMTMEKICGEDVNWTKWICDEKLLQASLDLFITHVLERPNKKDRVLDYVSGIKLNSDSEYLEKNGHKLEALVKEKYMGLKSFCRKNKEGELKSAIVNKSMITYTDCKFIPSIYIEVFSQVQK